MITLQLTQNYTTLIDDQDAHLALHKWTAQQKGNNVYTYRYVDGKSIYLHRELLQAPAHLEVDHVNADTLDNRRSNLRLATRSQNSQNKGKQRNNTSGYKGVSFNKVLGKYTAQLSVNRKKLHLGCFTDPEQAAHVYDKAARQHFGEYARVNFIEE